MKVLAVHLKNESDQSTRCSLEEVMSPWPSREPTKDWLDCADAQAYLSLRWARMSEGTISHAGVGGSVGCAVRLKTRRSRVQPPPRSATFFRGD